MNLVCSIFLKGFDAFSRFWIITFCCIAEHPVSLFFSLWPAVDFSILELTQHRRGEHYRERVGVFPGVSASALRQKALLNSKRHCLQCLQIAYKFTRGKNCHSVPLPAIP